MAQTQKEDPTQDGCNKFKQKLGCQGYHHGPSCNPKKIPKKIMTTDAD